MRNLKTTVASSAAGNRAVLGLLIQLVSLFFGVATLAAHLTIFYEFTVGRIYFYRVLFILLAALHLGGFWVSIKRGRRFRILSYVAIGAFGCLLVIAGNFM